jgi:hypothetical protein
MDIHQRAAIVFHHRRCRKGDHLGNLFSGSPAVRQVGIPAIWRSTDDRALVVCQPSFSGIGLMGGNGLAAADDASSCIEKLHRFQSGNARYCHVGASYG